MCQYRTLTTAYGILQPQINRRKGKALAAAPQWIKGVTSQGKSWADCGTNSKQRLKWTDKWGRSHQENQGGLKAPKNRACD